MLLLCSQLPGKGDQGGKKLTEIIFDRCIGCGNCLSNCPQKAKIVTDKVGVTERLLNSGTPVIAVLGCSYPAFFHYVTPGQLAAGLRSWVLPRSTKGPTALN